MYESQQAIEQGSDLTVSRFLGSVYKWMTLALLISAIVSWQAASSVGFIEYMAKNQGLFWALMIAQIVAVVALAGWVTRMSKVTAAIIFLLYAALTGLTLSTIFLVYTAASIAKVFVITAGAFGALSIYGYTTSRDLSAWRSFLFMSLIGIIIASVVNIFLQSPAVEWITSLGGVIIFAGLTAYDTQKLKYIGQMAGEDEMMGKLAIHGALTLYLDFINLFLFLLRFMGRRD
jgi:hypothetical protein